MRKASAAIAAALVLAMTSAVPAFAADAAWSMESDCGACHTKEAQSMKDAQTAGNADASGGLDVSGKDANPVGAGPDNGDESILQDIAPTCLASKHASLQCIDCHTDEAALTKVHEGVSAGDRMPKRLRKAKIDPETLCATCHQVKELADKTSDSKALVDANGTTVNPHDLPAVDDHAKIDCLDCHSMHKEESCVEVSKQVCAGCHHAGVFECGTCH